MTPDVDVVVAGDGIAGCAAAITLATAGLEVAILSPPYRESIDLPETLAPAAVPLLHRLGISGRELDRTFPHITTRLSRWGRGPMRHNDMLPSISSSLLLGKSTLRLMLQRLALRPNCKVIATDRIDYLNVSKGDVLVRLVPTEQMGVATIRARMIVDATGRSGLIAHRLGIRRTSFDSLVSFWIRGGCGDLLGHATVTATVQDGWIFYAAAGAGRGALGFFTAGSYIHGKPSAASIIERVNGITELEGIVAGFSDWKKSEVTSRNSSMSRLQNTCGYGWIACGDALQTLDPLSSTGNLFALQQGIEAAQATEAYLSNDEQPLGRYCYEARCRFEQILRYRSHFYSGPENLRARPAPPEFGSDPLALAAAVSGHEDDRGSYWQLRGSY